MISLPLVEVKCLEQAKEYAGANSWAVQSCKCSEEFTTDLKNYYCDISALDGLHRLQLSCSNKSESCNLKTENGEKEYGFNDLANLIN